MLEAVSMVSDLARLNYGVLQALPTNQIFEHLVFLDSRQCPGIQLADLAAYIRQRPNGESDARAQAIVEEFQQLIGNAVRTYRWPWPAASQCPPVGDPGQGRAPPRSLAARRSRILYPGGGAHTRVDQSEVCLPTQRCGVPLRHVCGRSRVSVRPPRLRPAASGVPAFRMVGLVSRRTAFRAQCSSVERHAFDWAEIASTSPEITIRGLAPTRGNNARPLSHEACSSALWPSPAVKATTICRRFAPLLLVGAILVAAGCAKDASVLSDEAFRKSPRSMQQLVDEAVAMKARFRLAVSAVLRSFAWIHARCGSERMSSRCSCRSRDRRVAFPPLRNLDVGPEDIEVGHGWCL